MGDPDVSAASDGPAVFPDVGIRLHSRVTTADPTDAASALADFTSATTDVYNAVRTSVSGINNRTLGGTNGNYAWCVSGILNVTAATEGLWSFRYGGDFGRGGHLYMREEELEAQWNDDLWWANSYGVPAEVLEGNITLLEGWHRYEALGFEGCCDGPTGFQARAPGGSYLDLSPSNFSLRGAQCILTDATLSIGASESCSTVLDATKDVEIDASSFSPYALPGATVKYDLNVNNMGRTVDDGSLVLTDVLPEHLTLLTDAGTVTFTDGVVPSGLSFSYGGPGDLTDSVTFSTDGTDFTYVPSAPSDADVRYIRFLLSGALNPNDAGDIPSFTISLLADVK